MVEPVGRYTLCYSRKNTARDDHVALSDNSAYGRISLSNTNTMATTAIYDEVLVNSSTPPTCDTDTNPAYGVSMSCTTKLVISIHYYLL